MKALFPSLLLAGAALASPITITSGYFNLGPTDMSGVGWSFTGDGFYTTGYNDNFVTHCGFCSGPFQLVNPLYSQPIAQNGFLLLGSKGYTPLYSNFFDLKSPAFVGSVFLAPHGPLPVVSAAGTYDVQFDVGGAFCVSDDPHVLRPTMEGPGCFSVIGSAVAHYSVFQTSTPNAFFQPIPTIEIVTFHNPEPGTWFVGIPLVGLWLYRRRLCR